MLSSKCLYMSIVTLILISITACSNINSPVTPGSSDNSNNSSPRSEHETDGSFAGTSLLGIYDLMLSDDYSSAELVMKRSEAIGESYTVSGLSYFKISPCTGCFSLKGIQLTADGYMRLNFTLKHPFEPGLPGDPPSAVNRLDLDVFDVIAVIAPVGGASSTYSLSGIDIHNSICPSADGYTTELADLIGEPTALPFFLVVDESEADPVPVPAQWNKFAMGVSEDFGIDFNPSAGILRFEIYLTMGYGFSAVKADRLHPKYYNPEFNRKNAWKVEVFSEDVWLFDDYSSSVDVLVSVFDWQQDAQASTTVPYDDELDTTKVFFSSDVASVSVEIPGMTISLPSVTTAESGSGMPGDPLIFTVPIANENLLPEGDYIGLVRVSDERPALSEILGRDYLIHSPDGVEMESFNIPGYVTYQTFTATVVTDKGWARTWGDTSSSTGYATTTDNSGCVYVAGSFNGMTDFDPSPEGIDNRFSASSNDAFLTKFDLKGNYLWALTWGGAGDDSCFALIGDSSDNIYVAGKFNDIVDFDPSNAGDDHHTSIGSDDCFISKFDTNGNFQWALTWGGTNIDQSLCVSIDTSDDFYVAGRYRNTADFDPSPGGEDSRQSGGACDVFLSKFDPNGNFQWVQTFGGVTSDRGYGLNIYDNSSIYLTGYHSSTVDFDTGPSDDFRTSNGSTDIFLSKFDSNGIYQWAKTWGDSNYDLGRCVTTDLTGMVYVTGGFEVSVDFDPGLGDVTRTSSGSRDIFMSKFDSSGNFQWVNTWGDTEIDQGYGICSDSSNDILFTGNYSGVVDFDPGTGTDIHSSSGLKDIFISKFNSDGDFIWAQTYGNVQDDTGYGVAIDNADCIYTTGDFSGSVDFNPGPGEDFHTSTSNYGTFITKLLLTSYW